MKKFICMMFCMVVALSASAMNFSAEDYTPPPKMKMAVILPAMDAPAVTMDVQYLNVIDTQVVIFTLDDALITSKMASGCPMCAYIEKRGYYKRFQPPDSKSSDNSQQKRNMSRYHNLLNH